MATSGGKIRALKADGTPGANIDAAKYEAVKTAILAAVPVQMPGLMFEELPAMVAGRVPAELFRGASIVWYTTCVKLDLEARGLLKRITTSRYQRLIQTSPPDER